VSIYDNDMTFAEARKFAGTYLKKLGLEMPVGYKRDGNRRPSNIDLVVSMLMTIERDPNSVCAKQNYAILVRCFGKKRGGS
jgi:hypothetical protein